MRGPFFALGITTLLALPAAAQEPPAGGIYPGREVLTSRGLLTICNSRHNKEGL